ncbi:hypothetical protein V1289_008177 [Bradyrhizobium sp. AZCC 2289]
MDCFGGACHRARIRATRWLAMTWLPLNTTPQSRGAMRPSFSKIIRPKSKRAQGMPGACCTRGLVCKNVRKTHTSIQVQSEQSGIPRAMVLRLIPCSPRRRIRLVTVADGLKDCQNPVGSTPLRQLDTSNGCQDHTVLPYAAPPVVCTLCSLTDQSPPCEHDHAPDAAASTASRPNVRDDGQRPSTGTGWRELCR